MAKNRGPRLVTPQAVSANLPPLPPHILASSILRRKRIPKADMARFQEQVLLAWTPALLPKLYEAVYRGVCDGNKDFVTLAARIYRLIDDRGISVTTNLFQANNTINTGRGFDEIVRSLQGQQEVIDVVPEPACLTAGEEIQESQS